MVLPPLGGGRRKDRIRSRLRELYGDFCHWCQQRMIFEKAFAKHPLYASIEHLHERSKGGSHCLENLRLAHRQCNSDRSARPPKRQTSAGSRSPAEAGADETGVGVGVPSTPQRARHRPVPQ